MSNINLASKEVVRNNSSSASSNKSLIIVVGILIISFVLYGLLMLTNVGISSKIKSTQAEYSAEYNKFLAGNGSKILDFKNRGEEARAIIKENRKMPEVLGKIENSLLPSVYLNSLKYGKTDQKISLVCIGDSFQTVAKQVLSFKQNDYFSEVVLGKSFVDTSNGNKVNFNIDLKLK